MTSQNPQNLRRLPAVERVLNQDVVAPCAQHGRTVVAGWVRDVLDEMRNGNSGDLAEESLQVMADVVRASSAGGLSAIPPSDCGSVINGTGVVIHTNLGRAPLAAGGHRGHRGDGRGDEPGSRLAHGTSQPAGSGCGNSLPGSHWSRGRAGREQLRGGDVVGPADRWPPVAASSFPADSSSRSADLFVCPTSPPGRSRTAAKWARRIAPGSRITNGRSARRLRALLRVHPSNYRIRGFCESVSIAELAELGKSRQLPVIDDMGSGCLYDLSRYGLPDEPIVSHSLRRGPIWRSSAATSCSADRNAASSWAERNSSTNCGPTRWPAQLRIDKLTCACARGDPGNPSGRAGVYGDPRVAAVGSHIRGSSSASRAARRTIGITVELTR